MKTISMTAVRAAKLADLANGFANDRCGRRRTRQPSEAFVNGPSDDPGRGQPHDAAAGHREHQVVGTLAVDGCRELDGDEPRAANLPMLTQLRTEMYLVFWAWSWLYGRTLTHERIAA